MSLPHTEATGLSILATPIRRDPEGRYCLNDCHLASGGEKAQQPANFMRLDATKALIEEISRSSDLRNGPVSIMQGGSAQGTFVQKELVYAYAMWISPAFHLTVIRAFDAMVTGRSQLQSVAATQPKEISSAFRSYLGIAKLIGLDRNQAVLSAARAAKRHTGVDPLEQLGVTPLLAPQQAALSTPTDIGARLGGISARKANALLQERGFQVKGNDLRGDIVWEPTAEGMPFAVFQDTNKKHSDGTPVRQLKWASNVIAALEVPPLLEAVH